MLHKENGPVDWLTIIPLAFWIICIVLSAAKLCQTGQEKKLFDYLNCFNESTFSTFISMVIALSYKFFSEENRAKRKESGLSPRYISLTLISTVVYGVVAVINACRYGSVSIVIMTVMSITYVILFFKYMRA